MPGVDEIFRVVGLLTVVGFLAIMVAGIVASVGFGISRLVPRISRRVQARRFASSAVDWAHAEYRKERFRKDHGP